MLRGAVRVVTVLRAKQLRGAAGDLRPRDREAWRKLRQELEDRAETRRAQRRFRRDPAAYLTKLAQQLLK